MPKSQLADRLLDTVEEVLARVRAETTRRELLRRLDAAETSLTLENEPDRASGAGRY